MFANSSILDPYLEIHSHHNNDFSCISRKRLGYYDVKLQFEKNFHRCD